MCKKCWLLEHPRATVALSNNVDLALLSLVIDYVNFYYEREKTHGQESTRCAIRRLLIGLFSNKRKQFHGSP